METRQVTVESRDEMHAGFWLAPVVAFRASSPRHLARPELRIVSASSVLLTSLVERPPNPHSSISGL